MESLTSGTLAGTGSFRCEECGYVVTLAAEDELPACPGCGGARFARASLFAGGRFPRRRPTPVPRSARPSWPRRASASTSPGQFLAYDDGGERQRSSRSSASGRAWAAALPPTCASTTRPSRAATR